MGDRANCIIQYEGKKSKRVWFYTHWRGEQLPGIVKAALAKEWRWDDEFYLPRIIFSQLVKDQEAEEAGFGIALSVADNEHAYLVVDLKKKRVFFEAPPDEIWNKYHRLTAAAKEGWSFDDYIKVGPETMSLVEDNK